MRVPFDKYERVILIDTYMKIKDWPKTEWMAEIEKLSDLYRRYAVMRGMEINDTYRNVAGITMQLYDCDYIVTGGKQGLSGGARWMESFIELYRNDPEAFQYVLLEAKSHVGMQEKVDVANDITVAQSMGTSDKDERKSDVLEEKTRMDSIIKDMQGWDEIETAHLLDVYYAIKDIDSSVWDEIMRQECAVLKKYHMGKYSDEAESLFTISELAMKMYAFKLLEAGQGVEGEDYSSQDKKLFLMRQKYKREKSSSNEKKELSFTPMERKWDEYETARLIYECVNLKGRSIVEVIQEFYEHLRKYVQLHDYVMDTSRGKGAINRHALEIDYLLTDGRRGRKGGTQLDKNIVRMYRFRNAEFQILLTEANKRLGYKNDDDLTNDFYISWYVKNENSEVETIINPEKNIEEHKELVKDDYNIYETEEITEKTDNDNFDVDVDENNPYQEIMEREYPNGIKLNSRLDFNRFANLFEQEYGRKIEKLVFEENIKKITYEDNGRRKLKNNQKQKELLKKILEDFDDIYENGFSCIYLSCVFPHYKHEIEQQMNIYSEDVFWPVLRRGMHGYSVNGFGHITKDGCTVEIDENIRDYIRDVQREITYDELEKELWFIPLEKIKQVVRTTSSIINTASNTYMAIETFPVTNEELKEIRRVIGEAIADAPARQLQADECRRRINIECKSVEINTEKFSNGCFQKALGYLLKDDFNFTAKFITPKEIYVDTAKMYREFCAERDTFTMDELKEFSKEIDTPIRHDIIHDSMVRIDGDTFVKDSMITFDAKKIDSFIEENICTGKYMSLKLISSVISNFPSVENYRWTGYLLESYIYSFSEKFQLMNSSFSENDFNGVMVRHDAGSIEYDDLIFDVLLHKECETTDEALKELKEDGYITRAAYKGIDVILEKAKIKRKELKGE
ncbi:hypothetical protein SAMN05216582_11740 [Selenomonas ruminantium]|uniref:Uncharacterized protein n=1 Tax=Selenomonas ruminantium TaxID=971 RepID=A0A1M6V9I7_SELRU|nr:hypothetical protein [Selenomonas ruminantium]SHK78025.1 hypothetical protein SAMN05216582_11740 [Selenomonas ruminantium]